MVHSFVSLLSTALAAMVCSISFMEAVVSTNGGGFSIELVHRESPRSPFYNHSETMYDRLSKSILRSMSRADYISTLLSSTNLDDTATIQSQVIPSGGGYLMTLSIGTPPIKFLAIADTGSDLIWTQCKPCENCYQQDLPLFDPETSSTYRGISCESNPCRNLGNKATCENNACEYSYSYGDKSETNGILATETFTFDSTDQNQRNVIIPMLAFGCGHNNGGTFTSHGSGLVGLGGGPLSLVSQLGSKIDGKFSYCLVELSSQNSASSKLNFGSQAIISAGNNVVSTPLSKDPSTFYYLTLEAISVGDKRLENKRMSTINFKGNVQGNIIIDSGTTLTMLPPELYNQVESTLREAIPMATVQGSSRNGPKLCYSTRSKFEVPDIVFHFNGADVRLPRFNTFVNFSDSLVCLTMVPSKGMSIFGNLNQMNFLVEYDVVGRKVSFAPADCTKY